MQRAREWVTEGRERKEENEAIGAEKLKGGGGGRRKDGRGG